MERITRTRLFAPGQASTQYGKEAEDDPTLMGSILEAMRLIEKKIDGVAGTKAESDRRMGAVENALWALKDFASRPNDNMLAINKRMEVVETVYKASTTLVDGWFPLSRASKMKELREKICNESSFKLALVRNTPT